MKTLIFILLFVIGFINSSKPTPGVVYEKSGHDSYAKVVGYDGTETEVKIAKRYDGMPVKAIGDEAFANNQTITSVLIHKKIINIGNDPFYSCGSLTEIKVAKNNKQFESIDGNLYTKGGIRLVQYAIGKKNTEFIIPNSVSFIDNNAFEGCHSLTSVVIPDGVITIGDDAFRDCDSLTSIVIPDSVRSIGDNAFTGCTSLTSVVIGDSATSISDSAFVGCTSLKFNAYDNCKYLGSESNPYFALIKASNKNMSTYEIHKDTKIIANCAFSKCSRLASIVIPDSVTRICYRAFADCDSLASVVIPDSVTSIGDYAFASCNSLTSVVIGDSVTSIGIYAFSYCDSLTSVIIPDGVTRIGYAAFYGCTSLTSIVIPDSVTSIGDSAFRECCSLSTVVIPDSVMSIENAAFFLCNSLANVYYTGTEKEWAKIRISDYNSNLTDAKIHYNYVPEE